MDSVGIQGVAGELPPPLLTAGFPSNLMSACQPCTNDTGPPKQEMSSEACECCCTCPDRGSPVLEHGASTGCDGWARSAARELVAQLRRGKPPPWAHELSLQVPGQVPPSLWTYAAVARAHGLELANVFLFGDDVIEPPAVVRPYMSGEQDRALRPRDLDVSSFFASLFHLIQHESPVPGGVELAGWDLYHGHIFMQCASNSSPRSSEDRVDGDVVDDVEIDLGIMFHAKEFPEEFRHSTWGPTHPIGALEMGGTRDPRHGTRSSTTQRSYPLRNYLWLLSTNKIVLLDPTHAEFPRTELLDNQEFHSGSAGAFGSILGDINYFPTLLSGGVDAAAAVAVNIFAAADSAIDKARITSHHDEKLGWADFSDLLPAAVARAEAQSAGCMHEQGPDVALSNVLEAELAQRVSSARRQGYRWYSNQLLKLLRQAPSGAHCDLLCCPRSGHPADLQLGMLLRQACSQLCIDVSDTGADTSDDAVLGPTSAVAEFIGRLDESQVMQLQRLLRIACELESQQPQNDLSSECCSTSTSDSRLGRLRAQLKPHMDQKRTILSQRIHLGPEALSGNIVALEKIRAGRLALLGDGSEHYRSKDLAGLLGARQSELAALRAKTNATALQSLLDSGVAMATANKALEMTSAADGTQSDFRAWQLVSAAMPEYRSPELKTKFDGVGGWSLEVAHEAQKVAFYADSTIEALLLVDSTAAAVASASVVTELHPADAARKVVQRKEAMAREKWIARMRKQQDAQEHAQTSLGTTPNATA